MAGTITLLLGELGSGNPVSNVSLMPLVYGELRRMAAWQLRSERSDHTLQATALVHEAYLRLTGSPIRDWESRLHFFAVAARIMRQVLVDHARSKRAAKRDGCQQRVELNDNLGLTSERMEEVLAVHEALERLCKIDPRQGQLVELRFFGGLTEEEAAKVLGISSRTVKREWVIAKAWLYAELRG
jgi:RNA polymerase sigma-70 factor, ECF subfamily